MDTIDTRHFLAAVAVAEEGSLSRAAVKLNITQSAVSKQILALEDFLGHELFLRNHRRLQTTKAGEVFVQHAKYVLQMQDRAIQLSREAHVESRTVLHLGKSPYTDPFFISAITAIQKVEFPSIRLDVQSNFSPELGKQISAGVLDIAVLVEGADDSRLSTLELQKSPFYVLCQEGHPASQRKEVALADLHGAVWIRFARHIHPELYDRFTQQLEARHVQPAAVHHVTTAEEAVQLVLELNGVATITRSGAWRVLETGLTLRPLSASELHLVTVLAVRSDSRSPLITRFVKEIGKKLCSTPRQRVVRPSTAALL